MIFKTPIVVDLANVHISCLDKFGPELNIINIGTSKGTTVIEFINAFKDKLNINISYKILNRRYGDIEKSYCNNNRVYEVL